MKRIIATKEAPAAIGPYSQAVEANGFVFISGQIPIDPASGNIVEGGIEEQTRQVLKNIEAVLIAADCSFEKVVKTTCYLKDMESFAAFNEVYAECFKENPPARAAIEVARLPKDVLVEIEVVAVK